MRKQLPLIWFAAFTVVFAALACPLAAVAQWGDPTQPTNPWGNYRGSASTGGTGSTGGTYTRVHRTVTTTYGSYGSTGGTFATRRPLQVLPRLRARDLSEAQLQGGCEFAVRFNGAAKRIVYPAGVAKLAGNTLTIDGVLQ